MRVLMLGWELLPLISGGLGVACHGMFSALRREGIDVTFVVPWAVGGSNNETENVIGAFGEVHAEMLKGKVKAGPLLSYISSYNFNLSNEKTREELDRYAETARRIAEERIFDIVHAHDWMTCRAGMAASKALEKPLIVHFHSIEHDRAFAGPDHDICALENEGLQAADRVIAVSRYTRRRIIDNYKVDARKVVVVHNGADDGDFMQPMLGLRERWPKTVLFVGRLTAQKGPQHFLLAAKRVLNVVPDTRFIIVGEGDMQGYLEQMAEELGIADKVFFTGFLSRFELDRVYSLSHVCVNTSVSEPFGLVALEAMRRGIPVIVPRHAGVTEAVGHCIRIDHWDNEGISGAIIDVIDNHGSLADELSEKAARSAKKTTWKHTARKLIGIYESLLPSQC